MPASVGVAFLPVCSGAENSLGASVFLPRMKDFPEINTFFGSMATCAHPGDDVSDKCPDLEFREIACREAYGAAVSECIFT